MGEHPELPFPHEGTDAALWRDVALQAVRAGDMLADCAIDQMTRLNEDRVNEGLATLQSIPGYQQLSTAAKERDVLGGGDGK